MASGHHAASKAASSSSRQQRRAATRQLRKAAGRASALNASQSKQTGEAMMAAIGHFQAGRIDEAEIALRQVLDLAPKHADALHMLGMIAKIRGDHSGAAALIKQAIAVNKRFPLFHYNLALCLEAMDALGAAEAAFRQALALDPDFAEALNGLGAVLVRQDKHREADPLLRRAIALKPDFAPAYNNLGGALRDMDEAEEALACYRKALDLRPNYVQAHSNMAVAIWYTGQNEEAIAACDRALALDPDFTEAQWNKAYPLLTLGRMEEGWRAYEARLRLPGRAPLPLPYPAWGGESLDGKTILVRAEQGVGDEILFSSCLPELIAQAGHVVLECDPRLETLFARSFPQTTVKGAARTEQSWLADMPPIDMQVPIASLLPRLRPTVESFPEFKGHLAADETRTRNFAEQLSAFGSGLKVGVSWRSMKNSWRGRAYTPLETWGKIFAVEGVSFVNLQYDDPGAEIAKAEAAFGVSIHTVDGLDLKDDLDGVAALAGALDLVIAVNNATMALAGTVGTPLKSLQLAPAWHFFGTGHMPWLPNADVYVRESRAPDWNAPLARLAADLGRLAHSGEGEA